MTDDEAFLRAICENPEDLGLRLVFADWLEERGDERSARYLRLPAELRFSFVREGAECRWACVSSPALNVYWLPDLASLRSLPTTCSFNFLLRHGFVEEVICDMNDWFGHGFPKSEPYFGPEMVASQPIRRVRLKDRKCNAERPFISMGYHWNDRAYTEDEVPPEVWPYLPGVEAVSDGALRIEGEEPHFFTVPAHYPVAGKPWRWRRYDSLTGSNTQPFGPLPTYKWYASRTEAYDALSLACIAWARSQAKLPEWGPSS